MATRAFDLLVDALSVRRLTRLAIEDKITDPIRERIFKKWPPHDASWSYLLTCPWCASVWAAAGVIVARRVAPRAWPITAELLALSDLAGGFYGRPSEE